MTTESIIVYRNPMEAAFWDIVMNSPYTFPVMTALVACLIGIVLFDKVLPPHVWPTKFVWRSKVRSNIHVAFGITCAVVVFWLMV